MFLSYFLKAKYVILMGIGLRLIILISHASELKPIQQTEEQNHSGLSAVQSIDRKRIELCQQWRQSKISELIEEKTHAGTMILTGENPRYGLNTQKIATQEERDIFYTFLIRSAIIHFDDPLSLKVNIIYFPKLHSYTSESKKKISAHHVAIFVLSQAAHALLYEKQIISYVSEQLEIAQEKVKDADLYEAFSFYQNKININNLLQASSQTFETLFKNIFQSLRPNMISPDYLVVENGKTKPAEILSVEGLKKQLRISDNQAFNTAKRIILDDELKLVFEKESYPIKFIENRISYLNQFLNSIKNQYPTIIAFLFNKEIETVEICLIISEYKNLKQYIKDYNSLVDETILPLLSEDRYNSLMRNPFIAKRKNITEVIQIAQCISNKLIELLPVDLAFIAEELKALIVIEKAVRNYQDELYKQAENLSRPIKIRPSIKILGGDLYNKGAILIKLKSLASDSDYQIPIKPHYKGMRMVKYYKQQADSNNLNNLPVNSLK